MPFIDIGGTPVNEPCAKIGPDQDPRGEEHNRLECRAYIAALRIRYGLEPEGAKLRTKANRHDFGTYYEVVCDYIPGDQISQHYANEVENGLQTWDEVGMWPPVHYDDREKPILVMKDERLWLKTTNPSCFRDVEQWQAWQARQAATPPA
jgi:hypothetical protein